MVSRNYSLQRLQPKLIKVECARFLHTIAYKFNLFVARWFTRTKDKDEEESLVLVFTLREATYKTFLSIIKAKASVKLYACSFIYISPVTSICRLVSICCVPHCRSTFQVGHRRVVRASFRLRFLVSKPKAFHVSFFEALVVKGVQRWIKRGVKVSQK